MNWKKIAISTVACLAATLAGALIGVFFGRPAAEGQMLASGAIVFFYLLIGAVIGLGLAAFLSWRWKVRQIGWLVLGASVLVVIFWFVIQADVARQRAEKAAISPVESGLLPTQEEPPAATTAMDTVREIQETITPAEIDLGESPDTKAGAGYGFVSLPFSRDGMRILIYANGQSYDAPPVDSIVYGPMQQQPTLIYAPPYLQPFYQKMDWPIMLFRLEGVSNQRYRIALNQTEGRTGWVDKEAVNAQFWPEFLAGIFAVYPLDATANPVRVKALSVSDPVSNLSTNDILNPVAVVGDWIQVRKMGDRDSSDQQVPTGWLRWRDERGRILVGWDYML